LADEPTYLENLYLVNGRKKEGKKENKKEKGEGTKETVTYLSL
jgi:hypothetical protein